MPIKGRIISFVLAIIFQGVLIEFSSGMESKEGDDSLREEFAVHSVFQTIPLTLDTVFFLEKDKGSSSRSLLPMDVSANDLIRFLSVDDKSRMRLVARRYRDYIDLTFFGPVYDPHMDIKTFSSEISEGTIGSNIFGLLEPARYRIIIASDKCTNEEFLDDLLALKSSKGLQIEIVTGQDRSTCTALSKPQYSEIIYRSIPSNPDRSGKMHNKFIIVDDDLVITGSPNLTLAAYSYNVESFVAIQHKFVARLYLRYYEYIISGKDKYDHTQDEYMRVGKMMHIFNNAIGNPIQVCLAPILDIKTFVIRELNSLGIIDINMFLVSRASTPDDDIVDTLLSAVRDGAAVSIKVDENQYQGTDYMPRALAPLKASGAAVYTVLKKPERFRTRTKQISTIPQFHDKLVLMRHKDGSKKVFIGSAGFTDNVQDNFNLENMVLLKIPGVYDLLFAHFSAIDNSRSNLVVTAL